ncbi:hypothetical protein CC1G_01852 [Coprinopsis cinerea okayama7|uniref:Uncharacterized protein n=1 Tax=Coprinopsis cinerea (strain Okayama-7 / 130 / ATCC MYA-4618 / FGSC 9003) TaxID=240176 RepID=A8N2V0_COPC7|nr:hypothetical protein CC1G_01852 [Coprinopsis cinerea okayama7\|eukprot:XP_001829172.2 hypothetical protein CC1G_01852 [Coprinopsis cinerea okayama7\
MSSKTVKTYTQQSNRERPRNASEKKVVFKPVLDNPFRVRWPSVPLNLQNAVLAYLLTLLDGVASCHREHCRLSRKRKRAEKAAQSNKKRTLDAGKAEPSQKDQEMEDAVILPDVTLPPKPTIMAHMVLGINAVTKRLEHQARQVRRIVLARPPEDQSLETKPPIAYVFACRAEVNPSILIDHLPPLVAACNSATGKQFVKLVPLPKDSEQRLAESLGIRSASIIAIDAQYPGLPELAARLESVPLLTASWLTPSAVPTQLIPTHIKHVKTSAPKDMKAAREKRLQGRMAAKQRQKERTQSKK